MREVDRDVIEAARGMGMRAGQLLNQVELPLAAPLILTGLRTAAVQIVATTTIAAIVGGPGLGRIITAGLGNQDQAQLVSGAILVALLALAVEFGMEGVERIADPVRRARRGRRQTLVPETVPTTPVTRHRDRPVIGPSRSCRYSVLRSGTCGHDQACSPDTRDATVVSRDTEGGAHVRLRRILGVAVAGLALSLGATACGGDNLSDDSDSGSSESESKGELVIGSAGFTEINIMAEMYAALLQDAGYETTIQTVQNRELYEPALESGEIDVVPDYAATMTEFLNRKVNGPDAAVVATSDVETTVSALQELAEPLGLTALDPAEAVDQNAFVVSEEFATQNNLKTLSDLGASGIEVSLAAGRSARLGRSASRASSRRTESRSAESSRLASRPYRPSSRCRRDATSSGSRSRLTGHSRISVSSFSRTTRTPARRQPDSDRQHRAGRREDIATALNQLAEVLTTEDLAELNRRVDADREREADVARSYLEEKGLLST